MATVTSSTFNDDFKAYMTYSTSSTSTSYKVSISAAGVYIGCSYASYPWKTTLSATDKSSISGTKSTTRLTKGYHEVKDGSFSWTRKTSAYNVTVKVTTKKNISGGGSGSKSVTFTVPALPSYTISYNSNGGSGAPSSQKKYYGKTLTLSSTKPVRTGYTFLGWSWSSSATSATWSAGESYTTNASDTLYAVWKANTYTVYFNPNGGNSGSVTGLTKTYGKALTLPTSAQSPTRKNYKFLGWSTSSSATSATWTAGSSYSVNITANTTLYAVWEAAYIPAAISKLSAIRTNSSGTEDDEGVYGVATFVWNNGSLSGSAITPSSIIVQCKAVGTSSWNTVYTASSFTNKTITTPVFKNGSAALSAETQYDIKVTITDSYNTISATTFISKAQYIIDVDPNGNGIAFGAACSRTGLSTSWNMYMDNDKALYSGSSDRTKWYSMAELNTSDTFHFGYGGYNNNFGNTYYNGNTVKIRSRSDVDIWSENSGVGIVANGPMTLTSNVNKIVLTSATDLELRSSGDINMFPKGGTTDYQLYYAAGKSINYHITGAGYISNAKKSLYFTAYFSRPIVNAATVTVASYTDGGFRVRQNGKYLFGSDNAYKKPSSYSVTAVNNNYIRIRADFSSTTNAVNNDACGFEWYGTITFS
jgi:uncharacterized repeat protein (TIGR02543 family)